MGLASVNLGNRPNRNSLMKSSILKIHPADSVGVALKNLPVGENLTYNGDAYTLKEGIPAKHKFYLHDMAAGSDVIMYGVLVE